jgi:phage terminase large subunit
VETEEEPSAVAKARGSYSPWKMNEKVRGDNTHLELVPPQKDPTGPTNMIPESWDVGKMKAEKYGITPPSPLINTEPPKAGPIVNETGNKKEIRPQNFPQPSFLRLFTAKERYLVCHGGGGAGKSYAAAQKVVFKSLKYPDSRTIVIRKYAPQMQVTAFRMLKEIIQENGFPANINNTAMKISFPNGSEIHCLAIVDTARGEAASRIKSLTDVSDMWLEEPTELSRDEFDMIELRLRGRELGGSRKRQILMTFNPIDRNHWLHDRFFNNDDSPIADDDTTVQHYTYIDNIFLDEAYKRFLENIKDKNRYKVYTKGEWGELGDLVYENWHAWGDKDYNDPKYKDLEFDAIIGGADFGYAHPSAFVLVGLKEDEHELYILEEVYQHGTLNRDFIDSIKSKLKERVKYVESVPIYCDASEPASIEEMKQGGLKAIKAEKNILDGITSVRQYDIIIDTKCNSFLGEIKGYMRQKDAGGHVLEMPNKKAGFDDLMDALRYAVYTHTLKAKVYRSVMPVVEPGFNRFDFANMA